MNQQALDNSERYCVFRNVDGWFGIPALAVRSIVPRPELTQTPHCDPILKGFCHLQNEFVPVVSLIALAQIEYETSPDSEQQLMILHGPQGPWGVLIDQAFALAALEISISTFSSRQDKWSKVTIGSAFYQNQVVQILEPTALYHYASNLLDMFWQSAEKTDHQLTCNH